MLVQTAPGRGVSIHMALFKAARVSFAEKMISAYKLATTQVNRIP
jgi:hypothetical protein